MTASFCKDMNAYIIERYRTLAATLFCVGVLPVAVICSFDGLSPDQALNKSFYLTFISILNRPMSVRQKAASWLLFSLFTIFRVGKDKGVMSGRTIYRPKLGSLSHFVYNVRVDGTSRTFHCGATETAGKDVKQAYGHGNKTGTY